MAFSVSPPFHCVFISHFPPLSFPIRLSCAAFLSHLFLFINSLLFLSALQSFSLPLVSFPYSSFHKIVFCVKWWRGDWLAVLQWERVCMEVVKMTPPWGNTHSCTRISSSPCLLNGSHFPANCFEARPANPLWDLAQPIELAWSYRKISLLSIFERETCLFRPSPFPPRSITVLVYFSLLILPHRKHFCSVQFT